MFHLNKHQLAKMFLTTCVIFISYKVPQEMFKNVPQVKTKCGDKNASETFAERYSFEII